MIKFFSKRLNNKKGFTLIELIVVIAILGILAAIAIPRFSNVQDQAKIDADAATAKSIVSSARISDAQNNETLGADMTKVKLLMDVPTSSSVKDGVFDIKKDAADATAKYYIVTIDGTDFYYEETSSTTPPSTP